jgi:hypothetical protein
VQGHHEHRDSASQRRWRQDRLQLMHPKRPPPFVVHNVRTGADMRKRIDRVDFLTTME